MSKPLRLKLKQRWLPFLYGYLARLFIGLIALTCRYKTSGRERFLECAKEGKCVLVFWHNRLTMIAEILSRFGLPHSYAALISYSRDGEIISVLANSYAKGRSIRVPHDKRMSALKTIIREIKNSKDILLVTPDGPKGPLHKVKPGVVVAARETAAKIVPLSWHCTRVWKFPTWDKMMLPKPFSTITVTWGEPVLADSLPSSLEEGCEAVGRALISLEREPR